MLMFLGNFQRRIKYVMFPIFIRLKKSLFIEYLQISPKSLAPEKVVREIPHPLGASALRPMYSISFHKPLHSPGGLGCGGAKDIVSQKEIVYCCCFPGENDRDVGQVRLDWTGVKLTVGCMS